jgi:hypothetical protein
VGIREEFEAALRALEREHAARGDDGGAYESVRCVRSPGTMFSEDCRDCWRCLHCRRLTGCVDCTHCADGERLARCTHCEHSRDCSDCAYVHRSVACHECTYCYGCVGLVRKDFHILNVKYDRQEYFDRVAALERA